MGDIESGQCRCLSNCDGELSGDGCGIPVAKVVVADIEGGERGGHGGDTLDMYGGGGRAAGEKERVRRKGETRETRCGCS